MVGDVFGAAHDVVLNGLLSRGWSWTEFNLGYSYMNHVLERLSTYDHRVWRTGLPVRSAVLKPHAGRLVVWWVTTCESRLLYVFIFSIHLL